MRGRASGAGLNNQFFAADRLIVQPLFELNLCIVALFLHATLDGWVDIVRCLSPRVQEFFSEV